MKRFIFANMQGLAEERLSARLVMVAQLLIEMDVDVALLCEVMRSSQRLGEVDIPEKQRTSRRKPENQLLFDKQVAQSFSQNEALGQLQFTYTPSYREERYEKHEEGKQKGYGTLSKGFIETELLDEAFKALSTRAPLRWITREGMHVYMLHAISNHSAAKKQLLSELIPALLKLHPDTPWMIVGDLNCPPHKLLKCDESLITGKGGQVLSLEGVGMAGAFACIPDGPTRWSSGNLLDYVISNVPCRVFRLPEEKAQVRTEQQSISVLDESGFDHRPILVEYPELDRKRDSKPSSSIQGLGKPLFALPTYPARFRRIPITGDGNCLFRSIAHLTGRNYVELRALAVQHLLNNWEQYQGFVEHPEYVADMAGNGVWAGHLALVALANQLDIQIIVYRFDGTIVRINEGGTGGPHHVYYTGAHYDALVEAGRGRPPPPRFGRSQRPVSLELFLVGTVTKRIRTLMRRKPHEKELSIVMRYVMDKLNMLPGADRALERKTPGDELKATRMLNYLVDHAFKKHPVWFD
ncbi:hypothetical protein BO221_44705 [Archangium sp. Cb G35]|uniref:OTU domain-containing protein n=1 Tax=Archangium sp. Cb G35 TaxID=1920190 RepID=UPI000937BB6C|nr:OTU domain-containing protein [Archangium sp. Cb G35]OJT17664.1 hypothetical protein BO221_44705 [Archangium sp. Cb G35]